MLARAFKTKRTDRHEQPDAPLTINRSLVQRSSNNSLRSAYAPLANHPQNNSRILRQARSIEFSQSYDNFRPQAVRKSLSISDFQSTPSQTDNMNLRNHFGSLGRSSQPLPLPSETVPVGGKTSTGKKSLARKASTLLKTPGGKTLRTMTSTWRLKRHLNDEHSIDDSAASFEVLASPESATSRKATKSPGSFLRTALRDLKGSTKEKGKSSSKSSTQSWLPRMFGRKDTSLPLDTSIDFSSPSSIGANWSLTSSPPIPKRAQYNRTPSGSTISSISTNSANVSAAQRSPSNPRKLTKSFTKSFNSLKSACSPKRTRETAKVPPVPDVLPHTPPSRVSADQCRSVTSQLASIVDSFSDHDIISEDGRSKRSKISTASEIENKEQTDDLDVVLSGYFDTSGGTDYLQSLPEEDTRSSFEGNISTAAEAAAIALQEMMRPVNVPQDSENRPSFESFASSLGFQPAFGQDERPSYETARSSIDSAEFVEEGNSSKFNWKTNSCRSSFQHYLNIGRPGVGERMIRNIDQIVPLRSLADTLTPDSTMNFDTQELHQDMPKTVGRLSVEAGSFSLASPCPATKTKRTSLQRYSQAITATSTQYLQPQLVTPSKNPLKQSQQSSHLSLSSTASSPCPRPNKRVQMLTGRKTRLPRPQRPPSVESSSESDNRSSSEASSPPRELVTHPQTGLRPLFLAEKRRTFSDNIRSSVQFSTIAEEQSPFRSQTSTETSVVIVGEDVSEDWADQEEDYFQKRSALISLGREIDMELVSSRSKYPSSESTSHALTGVFDSGKNHKLKIEAFKTPDSLIDIARFIMNSEDRYKSISSQTPSSPGSVISTPPLSPAASIRKRFSALSSSSSDVSYDQHRQQSISPRVREHQAKSTSPLPSLKATSPLAFTAVKRQPLGLASTNKANTLSSSQIRRKDEVEFAMRRLEGKATPTEQKYYRDEQESKVYRSHGNIPSAQAPIAKPKSQGRLRQPRSMLYMR